jgi:hypothetical protein
MAMGLLRFLGVGETVILAFFSLERPQTTPAFNGNSSIYRTDLTPNSYKHTIETIV